jgi:hypothetical protein
MIHPLPQDEVLFPNVREVVDEFLVHHKIIRVIDKRRTHLGQALVWFDNIYDRDILIAQSPHPYGDVSLTLLKHNEGRNWRLIAFNR